MMFIMKKSLVLLCLVAAVCGNPQRSKNNARFFFSLFGGSSCSGCPQRYCDDDPTIIHGYCCGCARYSDRLPVKCSPLIKCPLNNYDLCEGYEYMLRCCCT